MKSFNRTNKNLNRLKTLNKLKRLKIKLKALSNQSNRFFNHKKRFEKNLSSDWVLDEVLSCVDSGMKEIRIRIDTPDGMPIPEDYVFVYANGSQWSVSYNDYKRIKKDYEKDYSKDDVDVLDYDSGWAEYLANTDEYMLTDHFSTIEEAVSWIVSKFSVSGVDD